MSTYRSELHLKKAEKIIVKLAADPELVDVIEEVIAAIREANSTLDDHAGFVYNRPA